MDSNDSVGAFALFDDEKDLSLDAYVASCYTLSETNGECEIEMDSNKHHLKLSFDLVNLKYWKEIKNNVPTYVKQLRCE